MRVKHLLRSIKQSAEYHKQRIPQVVQGCINSNGVRTFWYQRTLNFGDLITPLLLRHYGHTPVFTKPEHADLISTGSILEFAEADYEGFILGSGFVENGAPRSLPRAKVLSVRGELTRDRLGLRKDIPLGDPGLLLGRLIKGDGIRKDTIGYIPHYAEKTSRTTENMMKRSKEGIQVIDPQAEPSRVAEQIASCGYVLSSSLHGLIVADSMGIPTCWIESDKVIGAGFKFHDYYSSIEHECIPLKLTGIEDLDDMRGYTTQKPQTLINKRQDQLEEIWSNLKHQF